MEPAALCPTVAVAISTYNSGPYAAIQLTSILEQSVLPQQIVVGDDGSTDGTYDVMRRIADEATARGLPVRWTFLEPEHVGLRPNMVRIIDACDQDVVVIADHDDVCLPDRIERLQRTFGERPELLFLHTDADLIDPAGEPTGRTLMETQAVSAWEFEQYRKGEAFRVLVRRWMAVGAASGFRRSLVDLAGPIPDGWLYDGWFAHIAAALGRLDHLRATTVRYRVHPGNSVGVRRRGIAEKLGMLRAQGDRRNAALLARAEAVVHRLGQIRADVPDWSYDLACERLRHEQFRATLAGNRLLRWPGVVREARTGAYDRLGRGKKDVLLDLVQPLA